MKFGTIYNIKRLICLIYLAISYSNCYRIILRKRLLYVAHIVCIASTQPSKSFMGVILHNQHTATALIYIIVHEVSLICSIYNTDRLVLMSFILYGHHIVIANIYNIVH